MRAAVHHSLIGHSVTASRYVLPYASRCTTRPGATAHWLRTRLSPSAQRLVDGCAALPDRPSPSGGHGPCTAGPQGAQSGSTAEDTQHRGCSSRWLRTPRTSTRLVSQRVPAASADSPSPSFRGATATDRARCHPATGARFAGAGKRVLKRAPVYRTRRSQTTQAYPLSAERNRLLRYWHPLSPYHSGRLVRVSPCAAKGIRASRSRPVRVA